MPHTSPSPAPAGHRLHRFVEVEGVRLRPGEYEVYLRHTDASASMAVRVAARALVAYGRGGEGLAAQDAGDLLYVADELAAGRYGDALGYLERRDTACRDRVPTHAYAYMRARRRATMPLA